MDKGGFSRLIDLSNITLTRFCFVFDLKFACAAAQGVWFFDAASGLDFLDRGILQLVKKSAQSRTRTNL